ncbi:UDP-N-acetylmuramate dehydrogenase [Dorea acetigenes]|uniref:UDP-N-acetylenolpyruvoylglucosamine reductase n=1 Tax=Dorea acetigenes TaxID=2981787 RepID=A0ABT2RS50_9FIRM|nr:UDP-N-acetylmuramate dehydrogenase [Dorea acetigenes]MCU6688227.1 UDP-N-acetylmuramate dehydrogenase [Dorea acetigenes]SCJ69876.1 UDP-N-acetylenolpyruvoylglucosamine reductase [uncultured Clostridium sp.]
MGFEVKDELEKVLGRQKVLLQEPMKKHTTFRVGGPADYFVMPETKDEIRRIITVCRECGTPFYIIGNGSNLLVSDKGYRGVIIQLYKEMSKIETEGNVIRAEAGASLARVANAALEAGLTGFEFASGIPGTLGGACVMNAGAYGGEMKDVLLSVTALAADGEFLTIPKDRLELGYRTSVFARKGYIVVEALLELKEGSKEAIRQKMEELREKRITKQPLEYPSAGSTFKRPEGYFAGKLIQDAGLRGYRVGGAQVSEKHCGFVINCGNASAADVDELMKQVSAKVEEQFGVTLEPEVKRLGEF